MKYVNENGRSMVEMLGVLAIIGVLSVGGIAGYSKAMNKFKINKTTDQVSMLVANIRTIYSTQGNYDGLTNDTAVSFGVVPNDMIDGSALKNAFGGTVYIKAAAARSTAASAPEAFIIEYQGLSQEACVTIATGDWGSGQSSGLLGIAAAGSAGAGGVLASTYTDSVTVGTIGTFAEVGGTASGTTPSPSAGAAAGLALAAPGATEAGSLYPTPMPVTAAVTACNGTGTVNSVAWKYY